MRKRERDRESTLVAAATAVVVVVVEVEVGVRVVCSEAWRGFVPAPLPCTCPNTRPPLTCPRPPHSLPPSCLAPRPPTYIHLCPHHPVHCPTSCPLPQSVLSKHINTLFPHTYSTLFHGLPFALTFLFTLNLLIIFFSTLPCPLHSLRHTFPIVNTDLPKLSCLSSFTHIL